MTTETKQKDYLLPKQALEHMILALQNIASKDATRYHLNSVFLKFNSEESTVTVDATDGHKMTRKSFHCETDLNTEFAFDRDTVPALKAMFSQAKKHYFHGFNLKHGADDRLHISFLGETSVRSKSPLDNQKPDFDGVMKTNEIQSPSVTVYFNAEYLEQVLNTMRQSNKEQGIKMHIPLIIEQDKNGNIQSIKQSFKAMVYTNDNDTALIMPMRIT